jgi:DNA-binding protein HU-beta
MPNEEDHQMTKADLVEKMAKDSNISKVAAGAALDSFMTNVTKALKKKNGKVTLVGFGTFSKTRQKARKGRNPQTGEAIKIKAKNVVKFKAGKKLKDSV